VETLVEYMSQSSLRGASLILKSLFKEYPKYLEKKEYKYVVVKTK